MTLPINLDKLNAQYPCDKRTGHAKACDCAALENPVETKLVRCEYYKSNVRESQCKDCRYQRRYLENINK
jgi:hypothetical protein